MGCLFLYGALDSHPFFPSHAASGRCVLSAAAACAPAGVVSALAERRRWFAGAVLVAAGAVCALVGVPGLCWLLPPLPLLRRPRQLPLKWGPKSTSTQALPCTHSEYT